MEFYIFCSYQTDWRSEALHQLCAALRSCGERAFMWYTDANMQNRNEVQGLFGTSFRFGTRALYTGTYDTATTPKFQLEEIDKPYCIWILSDQHCLDFYKKETKAHRVIWFLDIPGLHSNPLNAESQYIDHCTYLTQTHLGEQQLKLVRAGQPIFKLTDYVHQDLMAQEDELAKERRIHQVIFNDQGGGQKHIVALRSALADVRFLGISQFPRYSLRDLGLKSSVYLDLGRHTHLHRRMREMVSLGTGLVVSNQLCAVSRKDIPINREWVINMQDIKDDPYFCSEMLRTIILGQFRDYEMTISRGVGLRAHLRIQQQEFMTGVQSLIDYLK